MPNLAGAAAPTLDLHLRFESSGAGPGLRVRLEGLGQVVLESDVLDTMDVARAAKSCREAMDIARVGDGDAFGIRQSLVRELGVSLAKALLPAASRALLAQAGAYQGTHSVRLHLHFVPEDPRQRALLALPWEALYDDQLGGFLDDWLAIVRRVPVSGTPKAPLTPSDPPLCVLAVLSSPVGMDPLDVGAEHDALARLRHDYVSRRLELRRVTPPATLAAIQTALQNFSARVLHFGGHGSKPGEPMSLVTLETSAGLAQPTGGLALGARLAGHGVVLAVLNGCDTLTTAEPATQPTLQPVLELLTNGLSAVVAMQAKVDDADACAFAGEFYKQLAEGRDVTHATWAGRRVWRRQSAERAGWTAPVLILAHENGALMHPRERAWWAHPATLLAALACETLWVVSAFARCTGARWQRVPWWDLVLPAAGLGLLLLWRRRQLRALRAHGVLPRLQELATTLWCLACVACAALCVHGVVMNLWR